VLQACQDIDITKEEIELQRQRR